MQGKSQFFTVILRVKNFTSTDRNISVVLGLLQKLQTKSFLLTKIVTLSESFTQHCTKNEVFH